ncbi:MAG: hydrogenase maturation protease [Oligoflexia bacterium]|nr:hydrogenase maturation protease [Oligoflexia bacterium]
MRYIIGIGNYSMADDSIGLRLIETIADRGMNTDFEAIDLSDNGLNLFNYLSESTEKMLWVDCVKMGKRPGEFTVFSPELTESQKVLTQMTTHEGDMLKILTMARQAGYPIPPIRILGIEPEKLEPVFELSPILQSRFEEYLGEAIRQIRSTDW